MTRKVKRDAVIKRGGESRVERSEQDREHKEHQVTDDERVEMLRQSMFQSSLPDLPKMPGWHLCWLTTENPRDPIIRRERLGYSLIKASELPGWEFACVQSGQFSGCIMINEMIAAKIPTRLWERYMASNHHQEPLYSEQALVAQSRQKQEEAAQYGAQVIEMPGNVELGTDPGLQPFSSAYGEG